MVRRKRPRSDAQRAYRRTNERLSSLQNKVKEFNVLTEGRMCIVWRYKDEMSTFGDQQLVKSLADNIGTHQFKPGNAFEPTRPSSPTSSASSSQVPAAEVLRLDTKAPKVTVRWKKEDLDLLAVDFFGTDTGYW